MYTTISVRSLLLPTVGLGGQYLQILSTLNWKIRRYDKENIQFYSVLTSELETMACKFRTDNSFILKGRKSDSIIIRH
jgi:hypothetical protein